MNLDEQIAEQRGYLLRFARLQLRNDAWAEDAVSETLLAALSRPQAFGGRAQLRTWLVGILKHKLIDCLRERRREVSLSSSDEQDSEEAALDALRFQGDGHFAHMPSDWGQPEQELSSRQFLQVLESCTERLPANQGRVFLMREWMELDSEEICKEMGLSATNLYVLLHRARMRLRECLELHWFGRAAETFGKT